MTEAIEKFSIIEPLQTYIVHSRRHSTVVIALVTPKPRTSTTPGLLFLYSTLLITSSLNRAFLACVAATFSIDKHYAEPSSHALSQQSVNLWGSIPVLATNRFVSSTYALLSSAAKNL